ncbi:hypothetical protein E2P81_ATG01345 [Venturia nashicola]|nr:hypothetical protein E2P81_ATG01345 [Venturia nashicola]
MVSNSRENVHSELVTANRASQIHEDSVTALPTAHERRHDPASAKQDDLRVYTSTPLSPIPEDVLKLREEYRRSSAGSAPKTSGFLSRMKSLKSKVFGKFKPKPMRIAQVPQDEDIEDTMLKDLPNTVTQRKPHRLSRSKTPKAYVPSGSTTEGFSPTIERVPTPFTPPASPTRSPKADKSLPPIPDSHGSPISFNTLANFDDPFILTSTPEHTIPPPPNPPIPNIKIPENKLQDAIPIHDPYKYLISFLLSHAKDEELDAIRKTGLRRRRRDVLDAQVQAMRNHVLTLRNQIVAMEELIEGKEGEGRILEEEQEVEDGVGERGRGWREELEGILGVGCEEELEGMTVDR